MLRHAHQNKKTNSAVFGVLRGIADTKKEEV